LIALSGVLLTALIQWLLGRRTARAAERQADAAKEQAANARTSAEAAAKSAQAAQDSVGVNRETAAGVAKRAEADALAKRYQDAAGQLGHEKAAVRLAGVYAMAHLADDWAKERQQCVDVLCSYLRMPWPDASDNGYSGEYQVRATVNRILQTHLDGSEPALSWCSLRFDFTGARLVDFRLLSPRFDSEVLFADTTFEGICMLDSAVIQGRANFDRATINGLTGIEGLTLGGVLTLDDLHLGHEARFWLGVKAVSGAGKVTAHRCVIEGDLRVWVSWEDGTSVVLELLDLDVNGEVHLTGTWKDGRCPWVRAKNWEVGPTAKLHIPDAILGDSNVWGLHTIDKAARIIHSVL
jgi:hypothetical protein